MGTEYLHLKGTSTSSEEMVINLGPQHPSTHGVLRIILKVDGEVITHAELDVGYLHRGTEKLAENRTYPQMLVISDRWDYLSAMSNNLVWSLAVEKLMQIEIPPQSSLLRILMVELNRIASHLVFFGTYGIDIGAFTPFLLAFQDREYILDLFEQVCGARITYNYIRIGGVSHPLPKNWKNQCLNLLDVLQKRFDEYDVLLSQNPIFLARTKSVGVIRVSDAISYGWTGPNLRSTGKKKDVRKMRPYCGYDKFDFSIPVGENGDCYDRYHVRIQEMRQSIHIIKQVLNQIEDEAEYMAKVPRLIRPPKGQVYTSIESPRGELGIFLISDGKNKPYRVHVRPPSFINLAITQDVFVGMKLSDLIAVLGSVDIVLGEVDR